MNQGSTEPRRTPSSIVAAAIVVGAVMGVFEIANTSIGWHLASGDWILANREFLRVDPFSLTSGGAPWIDHEWLFQVAVSIVHSLGGPAGLVMFRAMVAAVLTVFLLAVGVRSGLSPAAALVLAVASVAGARGRFFVRPELLTLVIVPIVVWLFLTRTQRNPTGWLATVAALVVIGANAHGGALVLPPMLAGILAAECVGMVLTRSWRRGTMVSGFAGVVTTAIALLINPYGWNLFTVPLHLGRLVDLAHIPNPEWISPTPAQAPVFYVALTVAFIIMITRERRLGYWALLMMTSFLAIKHVRNVGLFFVLLPVAVAPALAGWRALTVRLEDDRRRQKRTNLLAISAVSLLALSLAIAPHPRFGIGFDSGYYPEKACSFLDSESLPSDQLYNDVRFGGYLIQRYWPERKVFQDDRNEIHEPLLRRIWEIFQASDVDAWSALLKEYGADTALVRYHPPIRVSDLAGNDLGLRGFSALWFPPEDWALVYWDDVAMILVRRHTGSAGVIDRHEYRIIRPDDLAHLERRLTEDPSLAKPAARELARAARANPASWRAQEIARIIRR